MRERVTKSDRRISDKLEVEIIKHGLSNRPKNSFSEKNWLARNITFSHEKDEAGNIYKKIGGGSEIVYLVEINHERDEKRMLYRQGTMIISKEGKWESEKDVGISIMLEMINAQVPGYYIFLRSRGSEYIKETYGGLLKDEAIEFAILFWQDQQYPDQVIVAEPRESYLIKTLLNYKYKALADWKNYAENIISNHEVMGNLRNIWSIIGVNPGCYGNAVRKSILEEIGADMLNQELLIC